jgi:thiosulfate/3-mercaptopyruvate sulfurtransferase
VLRQTCGSGMTASVIWLALNRLGVDARIYDESWSGYAARPESEIASGEA